MDATVAAGKEIIEALRNQFRARDARIAELEAAVVDLKRRVVDATNTMSRWQGRAKQLEHDLKEKTREVESLEKAHAVFAISEGD